MTMKIMIEKLERIETGIAKITTDVAVIQEHMKTQNGNVARNVNSIEKNRKDIEKLTRLAYKVSGGLAVLVMLSQLVIQILL